MKLLFKVESVTSYVWLLKEYCPQHHLVKNVLGKMIIERDLGSFSRCL